MMPNKMLACLLAAGLLVTFRLVSPTQVLAAPATSLNCRGCVDTKHLKKNAVTSKTIKNKTIKPSDLAKSAQPSGVEFDENEADIALDTVPPSVISTTVTAPTGGFVVVVASWYFAGDTDDTGRCYLNTTPNTEEGPSTFSRGEGSGSLRDSAAMTRTFQVSGGDTSFHLNCTDSGTDMHVVNPLMSALFVPNRY